MSIGDSAYGNSGIQAPGTTPTGYCVQQDILYRIPEKFLTQLTNDTTGSGEPNAAVVNDLILEAYDLTNSMLAETYDVPFASTPAIIKRINVTLCVYWAMERQFASLEVPKSWEKRYDHAMEMLEQLANEELTMPDVDPSVTSSAVAINADRGGEIDFNDDDSLLSDY